MLEIMGSFTRSRDEAMNRSPHNPRQSELYGVQSVVVIATANFLPVNSPGVLCLMEGSRRLATSRSGLVSRQGRHDEDRGWNGHALVHPRKIAHATIRVVFQLTAKESDSGVFIRIPEPPIEPWMPINRGYEVEIGDWPDDYSCTGVLLHIYQSLARPIKPDRRMEHDGDNN